MYIVHKNLYHYILTQIKLFLILLNNNLVVLEIISIFIILSFKKFKMYNRNLQKVI